MMLLQFCFPTALVLAEELSGEVGIEEAVEAVPAEEGVPPDEEDTWEDGEQAPEDEEDIPSWGG